ncbi:MAG: hypothetical protein ABSC55_24325 [Syntrophorhabdales bacterium]
MKSLAMTVTPAILSVAEILDQLGYVNRTLIPSIVKFYEHLTGTTIDLSHIAREDLVSVLTREIDRVAVSAIKKLLAESTRNDRTDTDSISVSGKHCFGARGWYLVVEVEMQFYYTMALDFLDALKQKKRTVYPIVRDLLSLILRSGKVPGMMPDEILEFLCPCDEEAFDDEEDRKAFKRDRDFVVGRYAYHIRSSICSSEEERRTLLKAAHACFRKLRKKTLDHEQRSLIRNMLKLASLCLVKQYEKLELLPDEYDENPVYHSFGVLWGHQDRFSYWSVEAMDDQWGNSGPAKMRIIVRDRDDLARVRIILRTLLLLEDVFYFHDLLRL